MLCTDAPNGISESFAILKHCMLNGIPIIVIQKNNPIIACSSANSIPENRSHRILASSETVPPPYTISFPNGQKESPANLKHCIPIGIPMIVMHHNMPANIQLRPKRNPPNKNHAKLPKQLILFSTFIK